jgi:uncharacterized protein
MVRRSVDSYILSDLDMKVVLLSGPRQVGKTTFAKSIFAKTQTYLNFDLSEHRKIISDKSWSRDSELIVFDELHKMKNWKSWLKGIYDVEGVRPRIIVTGSARMDHFRKTGDSLAGRHFHFRMHPFSLLELKNALADQFDGPSMLARLLEVGGFPEPFFSKVNSFAARWRKSHIDRILREDLLDLESVRNLKLIEILVDLLADRVGSAISYAALARDLEVSPHTVKRWIGVLESLFVIFIVTPYSKKVSKSILKEPKIYFFDQGRVTSGPGGRLENLVALHLLKRCDFLEDTVGDKIQLNYLKNKDRHEVDFLTVRNRKPELMIEVKNSDMNLSGSLKLFAENLKPEKAIQVVLNFDIKKNSTGLSPMSVVALENWLLSLET